MNTNLIALRRKERYESLNLENQKELDNFYDTKAATHQLKVIKKVGQFQKWEMYFLCLLGRESTFMVKCWFLI